MELFLLSANSGFTVWHLEEAICDTIKFLMIIIVTADFKSINTIYLQFLKTHMCFC